MIVASFGSYSVFSGHDHEPDPCGAGLTWWEEAVRWERRVGWDWVGQLELLRWERRVGWDWVGQLELLR